MGLNVACAVLELGGDVICIDQMEKPLSDLGSMDDEVEIDHGSDKSPGKAAALREKNKSKLWYYTCDISDTASIEPLLKHAISKVRYPLRGFVACAGISDGGPSVDFPIERFQRLLDVNVAGTFACAQAVARIMHEEQALSYSIVLIASMSAHVSNKVCSTNTSVLHPAETPIGCRYCWL